MGGENTFLFNYLSPRGAQTTPRSPTLPRNGCGGLSRSWMEVPGKLNLEAGKKQDRGFRVFKLAESNFTPWDAEAPKEPVALAEQLEMHVRHIRQGRTDQDILYEILLKDGFPPTTPVQEITLAETTSLLAPLAGRS